MTEEAQGQQIQDGRIQDEDELYKKLYYLRCLKKEQQQADERRDRELAETDAWYKPDKETRSMQIANVEALISDFYMRQYEQNPHYRFKSRNGNVSKRKSTKFDHDDKRLVNLVDPKFVKTTKELKWGAYKSSLTVLDDGRCIDENGEIVPVTAHDEIKVIITTKEDD